MLDKIVDKLLVSSAGRQFQTVGAAWQKARLPKDKYVREYFTLRRFAWFDDEYVPKNSSQHTTHGTLNILFTYFYLLT